MHGLLQLVQTGIERLARIRQQVLQGERAMHRRTPHKISSAAALLQTLKVLYAFVSQRIELTDHGESVNNVARREEGSHMITVGGMLLKSAAVAGDTRISETNCTSRHVTRGKMHRACRRTSSSDMQAGL